MKKKDNLSLFQKLCGCMKWMYEAVQNNLFLILILNFMCYIVQSDTLKYQLGRK